MDERLLDLFRREVRTQCRMIVRSGKRLDSSLEYDEADPRPDLHESWLQIQVIVVAAANVSKMLWGSGGRARRRRKPLRVALQVADTSPLRSPSLRNDFEHFDERLEDWFVKYPTQTFAGRNIGDVTIFQQVEKPWFQHYDPTTGEVSFFGHAMSIPDVVAEARRIMTLVQT